MDPQKLESGLQTAFAIQLAVFGFAHLFRPRPLIQFFVVLNEKREAGAVFIAMLSLCTGSFLVAFHNIWSGVPILLTLFGWLQLIKGITYLFFPAVALRQFAKVTPENENAFRWPGIPLLLIAALLAIHILGTR